MWAKILEAVITLGGIMPFFFNNKKKFKNLDKKISKNEKNIKNLFKTIIVIVFVLIAAYSFNILFTNKKLTDLENKIDQSLDDRNSENLRAVSSSKK